MQQFYISIQLNKNTAGLDNFRFQIESTILTKFVHLKSLLELITFYIILINTYFLLCLPNIDQFRAFFNNITNEIIQIQPARHHLII